MKAILTTDWKGGVRVTTPALEMFVAMSRGGYWLDRPRGFLAAQIERQIEAGIDPDHARRYAHALQFGGLTSAEVYALIRDRDCARHGKDHDLIDPAELPDRWFRNAWARGHNGGPVWIDVEKARWVQVQKISRAIREENKRRRDSYERLPPIWVDLDQIRAAVRNATDETEIRRIWPTQLHRH